MSQPHPTPDESNALIVKHFPDQAYETCLEAMQENIKQRVIAKKEGKVTDNELWLVEHQDVYTLGLATKPEHILVRNDTPIVQTDRGGQVTWHGKGQLVAYFLFDLDVLGWSVRQLVSHAEDIICDVLTPYLEPQGLTVKAKSSAPGVYVYEIQDNELMELGKIASLGFKIKHGFSYHGIAINIDCDLSVFNAINPCGFAGMRMLNLVDVIDSPIQSTELTKQIENALEASLQKAIQDSQTN